MYDSFVTVNITPILATPDSRQITATKLWGIDDALPRNKLTYSVNETLLLYESVNGAVRGALGTAVFKNSLLNDGNFVSWEWTDHPLP